MIFPDPFSSCFQSENLKKKPKKSLHVSITKKNTHAHKLIFFHKLLHDFQVKYPISPISSIKRIELSVKFKLFQWFHDLFTVLCLSLDWKIDFNFDCFKNSLGVASKMFDVFYWNLYEMIPQNCLRKKLDDEVTENWYNVEDTENELDCYSND